MFIDIFCWLGLVYVTYRVIFIPSTPTLVSEEDTINHVERWKSALFYVPFVPLSIIFVPRVFQIFVMLMLFSGVGEYIDILLSERKIVKVGTREVTIYERTLFDRFVQILSIVPSLGFWHSYVAFGALLLICCILIFTASLAGIIRSGKKVERAMLDRVAIYLFGYMWLVFPLSHAQVIVTTMHIDGVPYGAAVMMLFLIDSWMGDVFAYYIGKNFGTIKIMPNVSPGKTLQGCLAAIVGCISFCLLINYFEVTGSKWLPPIATHDYVLLGVIVGFFGIFGDALESFVKRVGGVKDSGTFFPGHGGVLDRFDTFLVFGAPAFYYYVFFVGDGPHVMFN